MKNTTKIRKAVFPVAGFGIRFLPATKAMPKELLTIVDKFGRTPLHLCAISGNLTMVKNFFEMGADIYQVDTKDGWSPLHYAVQNSEENNEQVVQLLLDYVPTLGTQRDQNGLIPYHVAAATTTTSSSNIRKYLPKDNNICFWLTQYIMFFFLW